MSDYDPYEPEPDYPDGEEDDREINLENKYYESEDKKNTDPEGALEGLSETVQLEKELADDGKRPGGLADYKYTFNALRYSIVLVCDLAKQGKEHHLKTKLQPNVKAILEFMSVVAPNDANDATSEVIDALISLRDAQECQKNIELILEELRKRNSMQLFFQAAVKLSKIYLDQGFYQKLEAQLQELKNMFRLADGTDDKAQSDKLIQIYSLEIEHCQRTEKLPELRIIHKKVQRLANTGLNDQRVQSIIQELAGKIFMSERRFSKAEAQLTSAFQGYSNISSEKSRSTLKLLYIASILAKSTQNPSKLQESQVYRLDAEVMPLIRLREAYDRKDMPAFNRVLTEQLARDPSLSPYMLQLKKVSSLEKIQEVIKPYSRIRLSYLAKVLACDLPTLQIYLVQMIMEKTIRGRIDAVGGFFENSDILVDQQEQKQLEAIERIAHHIDSF